MNKSVLNNDFAPISDHALIGDLQTAALVSTRGTIDWYCCPRFDSPSVFGSLIDANQGGRFEIHADEDDCAVRQLYLPDTAILFTRFMTPGGVGELIDFMPIDKPELTTKRHRLVRVMRCVRGTIRFQVRCSPRFDYARAVHKLEMTSRGAVFGTDDLELTLHASVDLERDNDDVVASVDLAAGQAEGVMLESFAPDGPRRLSRDQLLGLFEQTKRFWRGWLQDSTYKGRWREMVSRSAITLKLLTYAPTGAPIAAATTSLPEQVGGERNWDYRFTWIRDASFSIHALLGLGFVGEAEKFGRWLSDRVDGTNGADPLKIMYRVDGTSDLTEEILDLDGYLGSKPVRVGNGAADQLQLDIYGELLDSLWLGDRHGIRIGYPGWMKISKLANWVCDNWDQPDEGIWETRGGRQHFTYGLVQCWVALDRIVRLAQVHAFPAQLDRWISERDNIFYRIVDRGWNPKRQAFTQHDQTTVLDASLLMMPLVGFISPTDPMWQSTLDAMSEELVSDSLVYRYDPSASPDGLQGSEGTFSICTFWYVDALARSGRLEEARNTFEKMLTYANHVGLYAEEIGLTGEQLGNFPQAFTHLSLINAAINLDYQLDHGAGADAL